MPLAFSLYLFIKVPFYFNYLNFSILFYFYQKNIFFLPDVFKNINISFLTKEDFLIFCRI